MTVIVQPNPYIDASPWGVVDVGGLRLPGVVVSVDGVDKPEDWNVQKPTSKAGATTVWKGTKLAEQIKIVVALPNDDAFRDYYTVRDVLRPKLGTKPPTLSIVNPIINFSGVTRVSCRNVGAPKWVAAGGYWTGEVLLLEYNPPKPANTGVAGQQKNNVSVGDVLEQHKVDPNQALNDDIDALTKEAKTL
jgi:hypothetical protein